MDYDEGNEEEFPNVSLFSVAMTMIKKVIEFISIYGIPFVWGVQKIFYQKDLGMNVQNNCYNFII